MKGIDVFGLPGGATESCEEVGLESIEAPIPGPLADVILQDTRDVNWSEWSSPGETVTLQTEEIPWADAEVVARQEGRKLLMVGGSERIDLAMKLLERLDDVDVVVIESDRQAIAVTEKSIVGVSVTERSISTSVDLALIADVADRMSLSDYPALAPDKKLTLSGPPVFDDADLGKKLARSLVPSIDHHAAHQRFLQETSKRNRRRGKKKR